MYGYIYKTTCLVNSKIYIGQKKSKTYLGKRYLGSGTLLKPAIKKYGRDQFITELICECETPEELNEAEKKYIAEFNAQDLTIAYNIEPGGQGIYEHKNVHTGGMKGKHQSDYQKQRASECNKGRPMSEEARRNMSIAKTGKTHISGSKGYIAITLGTKESNIMVSPEKLNEYLLKGYYQGSIRDTSHMKEIYSDGEYMYKDFEDGSRDVCFVRTENILQKFIEGYDFGKKPESEYKSNKRKDYTEIRKYYQNIVSTLEL